MIGGVKGVCGKGVRRGLRDVEWVRALSPWSAAPLRVCPLTHSGFSPTTSCASSSASFQRSMLAYAALLFEKKTAQLGSSAMAWV